MIKTINKFIWLGILIWIKRTKMSWFLHSKFFANLIRKSIKNRPSKQVLESKSVRNHQNHLYNPSQSNKFSNQACHNKKENNQILKSWECLIISIGECKTYNRVIMIEFRLKPIQIIIKRQSIQLTMAMIQINHNSTSI